ncbi:hypothetical protein HD554DRAFT_2314653 [Boletus coccyginus]|nr:hypothetical protein HD554DRAFT_2314653 [Boletus coccyginus]
MLTSTSSRLCRLLLSLVVRLRVRLSPGRIALALRSWFAPLWTSILAFARRRGRSQIRLHVNDVPVMGSNNPIRERPQISDRAEVEEEHRDRGTLATLMPVLGHGAASRWQDVLARYQALTSNYQFNFTPLPATPEGGSQRYDPRPPIHSTDSQLKIPAGQQGLLSALPPLPDEWRRHVHPEGNVLFYHDGLRIFTENDISDHEKEREVLFCVMRLIEQAISTQGVTLDELTEIVVNVDNSHNCHYYFVDHTHRLLFWLVPRNMKDIEANLQGITEYNHIKYIVESRYWSHCEYYPLNRILPKGVFEDLRGMLNYFKTDMMTTDSSTSPFTQDELAAFLDLVNSLKDDTSPCSVWVIARLMAYFTENQFANFCGQSCARLNADTPLFEPQSWNTGIVFKVINFLLFGAPNEHAFRLQRAWVDSIVIQPRWKDFITRLKDEWNRYTLLSTVMLAVNISFLAVPGVLPSGPVAILTSADIPVPATTPTSAAGPIEITIYCSVVSAVASIVFSFSWLNVYSNPGLIGVNNVAGVMCALSGRKWGMGMGTGMAFLAITHGLPIASLLWSIALFFAALMIQIFGQKQPATFTTLGAECFIILLFAGMGVSVMRLFYGNHDGDDEDTSAEKKSPTRLQQILSSARGIDIC